MVKELINNNPECSSIVAVSSPSIASIFNGKVVKLKFGSIVE
jgi:hypothetical protein